MKPHAKRMFLAIGVLVTLTSLVACGFWSMTPEEKARLFTDEVTNELELNPTQRQKLVHLVDTFMKSREVFYRERQEEREAVLQMVLAETFDQRRALDMIGKKTRIIDQQTPAIVSAYADLHNSLNREQRAKIHERLVEMFDDYDKRRKGS